MTNKHDIFNQLFQNFLSKDSKIKQQKKISEISNSMFRNFKKQHPYINSSHETAYNSCIHIAFHTQILKEFQLIIEKTNLIENNEKQAFFNEFVNYEYTDDSILSSILQFFWKEHCEYKKYSFRYVTELFFEYSEKYLFIN